MHTERARTVGGDHEPSNAEPAEVYGPNEFHLHRDSRRPGASWGATRANSELGQ